MICVEFAVSSPMVFLVRRSLLVLAIRGRRTEFSGLPLVKTI